MHHLANLRAIVSSPLWSNSFSFPGKALLVGIAFHHIAHDARNFITVIIGNCDLIAHECSACGLSRRVRDIRKSAARIEELFRAFIAEETERDAPALVPAVVPACEPAAPPSASGVSLNHIICEMADLGVLRRYVDVILLLDPALPLLPASASEITLHRMLLNLCANAKHAMQKGAVYDSTGNSPGLPTEPVICGTITIATRRAPGDAGWIELVVSDTGPGMTEDEQQVVLERMAGGIEAIRNGHGHGLQIVQAMVAQLGGAIRLESAVGVGTTFTLALPLGQRAEGRGQRSAVG